MCIRDRSSDERPTAPPIIEEMRRIAEPAVPVTTQDPMMQPPSGANDNVFGNFGLEDFLPVPADFYGSNDELFDTSWPDAGGIDVTSSNMDWLGFGGPELGAGQSGVKP